MTAIEVLLIFYIIILAVSIGYVLINKLLKPKEVMLESIKTKDDIDQLIARKDRE